MSKVAEYDERTRVPRVADADRDSAPPKRLRRRREPSTEPSFEPAQAPEEARRRGFSRTEMNALRSFGVVEGSVGSGRSK